MKRSRISLVLALGVLTAALFGTASAATQAAPINTALPTITGTPSVGQTLTAENGTWTNSPTAYQYQWLRCGATGDELRRRHRRDRRRRTSSWRPTAGIRSASGSPP